MKTNLTKPGFELTFSLGIVAMLVLPPMVMAQSHKQISVTINNGDTTYNGKNIKDLAGKEHQDALNEINGVFNNTKVQADVKRKIEKIMIERGMQTGKPGDHDLQVYSFNTDTSGKEIKLRLEQAIRKNRDENGPISLRMEAFGDGGQAMAMDNGRRPLMAMMNINRRNSQNFTYSNTDNDGISTHINYSVNDASPETTKRITGSEKAELTLQDISITPYFTTGKTTLAFTLANKGPGEAEFKDSEGKLLWSDKISGSSFSKTFELPKNGIYYLQIKQNGKLGLRRILKEE